MNYSFEEIKAFEQERQLVQQKLARLRQANIVETDESVRFKLDYEISQLETSKADLDKKLAEAYNLGTESGQERLREKINALRISEPMGRVHLVNCNRGELRHRFEEGFDQRKQQGAMNHYYFLSACPTQLPPSFGERMVYELLGELLDGSMNAVYCRFDPVNNDRVKLEKLPLGYSAEKSQEMFRDFCASYFAWDDKQEFTAAIAENRLPLARYKYAVLPFYIRKSDWKPFFNTYFDWIAEQLAQRPKGGPTLLIFIVMYHKKLHVEQDDKSREILATVDAICQKHPGAGHFHPLEPVDESDLGDWFNDLGEWNNARIQPVLDTLVESLPPAESEQYQASKRFNMDRVEIVQEIAFDLYNK